MMMAIDIGDRRHLVVTFVNCPVVSIKHLQAENGASP
jgi:hypothetical protein